MKSLFFTLILLVCVIVGSALIYDKKYTKKYVKDASERYLACCKQLVPSAAKYCSYEATIETVSFPWWG
uniref:Uncharacterized protein n=1 Tax=Panagrolaimus sp. JU765 TaxID=591449 RepID=A0AC34Q331_9BILA